MAHVARRALLAILLPALLLAQTLGLLHATLHVAVHDAPPAAITQAAEAPQAHGWVADLFAHGDASACRLYDQLTHGDAAVPAAPEAAVPRACGVTPFFALHVVALAAASPFQARGPPALR